MKTAFNLFFFIQTLLVSVSALAQTRTWSLPIESARVGPVATIVAPGTSWPPGTPLGGFAAEAPVALVGRFYDALAAGKTSVATALACPEVSKTFTSAGLERVQRSLEDFQTRERVGVMQFANRSLVFVRLTSRSEVILRVLEVLPASGTRGQCINEPDPMVLMLKDRLAASMSDLTPIDNSNPYPNGIPSQPASRSVNSSSGRAP